MNFIDELEIEEILGEYYDFSNFTEGLWERADTEIHEECIRRGIEEPEGEVYYAICDGVIGRIIKGFDLNHCPYCGSENIEYMGDEDYWGETHFHCHECDSWFSEDDCLVKTPAPGNQEA